MTEIFPYNNLTWPEVAELPRDLPFVMPLGSSFASEKVAEQLGNPQRFGILPSMPFGWRGGWDPHGDESPVLSIQSASDWWRGRRIGYPQMLLVVCYRDE